MALCPKDGYTLRLQSQNGNVRNLICPRCGTEYLETITARPAVSEGRRTKGSSIFIEPKTTIKPPKPRKQPSKQKTISSTSSATKKLVKRAKQCDIKCPVHNNSLIINTKTLKLAGQYISFVSGTCPECKQVYLGQMPVRGAITFDYDGVHYELLDALSEERINEADKEVRRLRAAEEHARIELLRQQKEERIVQEAEKQARAKEKRAAKEAARKQQRALDQEARYEDYKNNPDKLFRAFYTVSRIKGDSDLVNINAASELFQLGYSVAKSVGLDAVARRSLLAHIIDAGKLPQATISSHLEYLLRLHGGDARYADACEKWQQDLNFVLDYDTGNRRTVYGDFHKGQ